MTTRTDTAPVSERAMLARLNRALSKEQKKIHRAKAGTRLEQEFGRYYSVSENHIRDWHRDLEQWGRETGCLQPWEHLEREA
jgi:hypothetical protein